MKKIISEGGIRNIRELSDRYKKAKIYFHQDLDGVATALAMKKYLEDNGIKVVDVEIIQYGDKEFAVKKADAEGEIMPVLVDFAHGKPMFVVHTDHHDRQAGADETKSTQFRGARSNVETLSQIVPASEIFTPEDVATISMVDSADYASKNITPEMVMNYVYGTSKEKSAKENRMLLGLVTNKLLLAFKNKPGFLETLVLDCKPSILSIFNKIKELMKTNRYADISSLEKNKEDYVQTMKGHKNVQVKDNIIVQYGGGSMIKPGSYDRYTPFRNNPEADFLVIAWPLGLLQASCNPFKKERELKGVNLGEIAQEVLSHWEGQLKEKQIPLSTIKWVSETAAKEESVGFTFKDFAAIYGDKYLDKKDGVETLMDIKSLMEKKSSELTEEEWSVLDGVSVPVWEVIQANSGGHKCITNVSGLNYIGRSKRPPQGKPKYDSEKDDSPYIKFLKMLQNRFVSVLQEKISESKTVNENFNGRYTEPKFYIDNSDISGEGVFANGGLKKGGKIGKLHSINKLGKDYEFTSLGIKHNHSNEPNCENKLIGNERFLVASRDIPHGEELTTNYRLQPDLEQPEMWTDDSFYPQIDGYRNYSPYQHLDYIIVNSNGIDCDNICWDLILVGDDGSVKFGEKDSGSHFFDNAERVIELPVKDGEDGRDIIKSEENFKNWISNKIKKNPEILLFFEK